MNDTVKYYTLYHWLYLFVSKAHQQHQSPSFGGNAFLYKRPSGYMCCALLYSKPGVDWAEIAARHLFEAPQIPEEFLLRFLQMESNCLDISEALLRMHKLFYSQKEDTEMKFNLFKLAQAAQTAMNVVDNVNATYNPDHSDDDCLSSYVHDTSMSGQDRAMSMARAAINQDWFDLAKLGFDALLNLVSEDPLPYEDYLSAISQYVDVKIQQFSMEENLKFVGGECQLSVDLSEKKVNIKTQLYFKNSNNKWVMKEITGNTAFNCFTADTLDNEITEIMNEGGRKFPITPPAK